MLYLLGISTCLCQLSLKTFTTLFHIIKSLFCFSQRRLTVMKMTDLRVSHYTTMSRLIVQSSIHSQFQQEWKPSQFQAMQSKLWSHLASGLPVNTYCIMMIQTLTLTGFFFHIVLVFSPRRWLNILESYRKHFSCPIEIFCMLINY